MPALRFAGRVRNPLCVRSAFRSNGVSSRALQLWNKCRRSRGVIIPCLAECGSHFGSFTPRKADVDRDENREHD